MHVRQPGRKLQKYLINYFRQKYPHHRCRKLVEYTQAHLPDPLLNLDPKWAKKKGRNGCVIS